jgi:glucuronate isomerase
MKNFLDETFLLETKTAYDLYYNVAKKEPIFDYHCHLIPSQISENKQFKNLTEIWLGGDHYKWRMMRAIGFDEAYITGNADPYDKFLAWTKTVQELIGNPLYHWTHLELQRYFDIYEPLNEKTASSIWEKANDALKNMTVKSIFEKFNVYAVGTTDDPIDSLEYHKVIADGTAPIGKIKTKVMPSFRPDKAVNIENNDFVEYIKKLGDISAVKINSFDDLKEALKKRLEHFVNHGCRVADHGLEYPPFVVKTDSEVEKIFKKALDGETLNKTEIDGYKTKLLAYFAHLYASNDMVMQLHFSVIRSINKPMFEKLGPDTGYDAVHDPSIAKSLADLLSLFERDGLPKTILYSLNPAHYYPIATIMGGFQHSFAGRESHGIKGKVQLGSAWWFCDHKNGMEEQMYTLADLGLLSAFVGMLTDSRSFLSYPRHEYFRRILCNMLGNWVENGEYPLDTDMLSCIVKDICFQNAKRYFE